MTKTNNPQLSRKEIMCQYPKCKKEATKSLGMDDPDAELYYYCDEHIDKVKMNTLMEIFKR
jgi:hypothetical protein